MAKQRGETGRKIESPGTCNVLGEATSARVVPDHHEASIESAGNFIAALSVRGAEREGGRT